MVLKTCERSLLKTITGSAKEKKQVNEKFNQGILQSKKLKSRKIPINKKCGQGILQSKIIQSRNGSDNELIKEYFNREPGGHLERIFWRHFSTWQGQYLGILFVAALFGEVGTMLQRHVCSRCNLQCKLLSLYTLSLKTLLTGVPPVKGSNVGL